MKNAGFYVFSPVLAALVCCAASASVCPHADLSGDCRVDWADVAAFASQWLDPGSCSGGGCADFDGLSGVDLADYAELAGEWRQAGVTLAINEFMASNTSDSNIADPQGDYDDWIEIHNYGEAGIDVGGLYLTDDIDEPDKWQIPAGHPAQTTVPAGGYVIFWADEDTVDGPLHADFKLSQSGEDIAIYDSNAFSQIDGLSFGSQYTDVSYGRYPDGNENLRFFSTPTPGADNNGAYIGFVEEPTFSHERGFYTSEIDVTVACETGGAQIYYTTDGREPVVDETPGPTAIAYTGAVHITVTTCLRAAAIKTGWMPSHTATHTYIYGATSAIKSLPVLSLAGDPNTTFFEPDGIMAIVGGYYQDGVWQSSGPESYNNPMQRGIAYERPVSNEFINWADGNTNFQIDCGIRVRGSDYTRPRYTRGDDWSGCWTTNKFGFNFFFRDEYGEKFLDYPYFPSVVTDRYRSIALRGGHNDQCNPFIKDEWARRLHRDMGAVEATGNFVNVFLNGRHKGYYNPCGRIDEEFLQEWHQTDREFDVITQSGVRDGTSDAWSALVNYAKGHNLVNSTYYQYVAARLDIEAFIDYLILEIYLGNWDWPLNNWIVAREVSSEGKFRFFVWDAEGIADSWALGGDWSADAFDDFPSWAGGATGLNNLVDWGMCDLYRALKANADFRQLFADRIHRHFRNSGALTKERLAWRFWELADEVSGIIPGIDTTIPNSFIPLREEKIMFSFDANGLFDRDFNAPVFSINGSYKHGGYITAGSLLSISNSNPSSTVYYTLDGNDPRLREGTQDVYLVSEQAAKKVLVPTYNIGINWRGANEPYNDASWTSGAGGVGYERESGYEDFIDVDVESQMYNQRTSCCIRIPFTVDACDLNSMTNLALRVRYDDGLVVYINGNGVLGKNNYGPPAWDSNATTNHEAGADFEEFDITAYKNHLKAGSNIMAIHGLNYSAASSDFLICAELVTRMPAFGGIAPTAIAYSSPVGLSKSTLVKSRVLGSGNQWSALNEATYAVSSVGSSLRITELMYRPLDGEEPNDANIEFVELKNTGASAINLNLVRFAEGIDFTFPSLVLAAGQHVLAVKDRAAFEGRYGTGLNIAGQYGGSLENAGERIRLEDAVGGTILDFEYKDGWRDITDGQGYSLTIIDAAGPDANSWGRKDGWRPSAYVGGSPGWDDSGAVPNPGSVVINEVMAHTDVAPGDWIELYNTTASAINIGGWFLSDSDSNLMKYRFASGTIVPAHGYLVVTHDANFGLPASDPGCWTGFALSENGETVVLASGPDANGLLTGYRATEDFGASEAMVSFGRYYKASTGTYNFTAMDHHTAGSANAYPEIGPIVITEIMYHPDWPANGSYDNDEYEYVELRNISASPVTLYDYTEDESWSFTDAIDYTFAASPPVTIPAGSRIVVVKNPTAFAWRYPTVPSGIIYGPYEGRLANEGEQLQLSMPGDIDELGRRQHIRVERVSYSDGRHSSDDEPDLWPVQADGYGKSLTRISNSAYGNDPNNFAAAAPSPGT